jgi:hypothetical protein
MELKQKLQAIWNPFWKSRATWWPTLLSLFMDLKKKLQPRWERFWKSLITWWPTLLSPWADLRGKSRLYRAWFYKHGVTWQLFMGLLLICAMVFVLWKVPQWQLEGENLEAGRRIQLENDLRKTLAQIMAGAFILIGGYLAWRRVTALERTVVVAQEGQITERFTRAIQLLGDRENLEVRLGGIYALERIAKDSPKDHWTIMEVLTAYIREHTPWEESPPSGQEETFPKPTVDTQAILTVLGRRLLKFREGEENRLDLRETGLSCASLERAHLEGAILIGTHLEWALLAGAHLECALLADAHLERARLDRAYLDGANLSGAHLEGANLAEATGLTHQQLEEAHTDDQTILPDYLRNS